MVIKGYDENIMEFVNEWKELFCEIFVLEFY